MKTPALVAEFGRTLGSFFVAGCLALAALPATGCAQSEPDGQAWIEQLASFDADERRAAREGLATVGSRAVPLLIAATETDSALVRWEAVNLLGVLGDSRATEAVLARAMFDDDVHVRWRSLWALVRVDDGTAIASLKAGLESGGSQVAWHCAVALSMFGVFDGVALLHLGLGASGWIQWEAINALGRVWDDRTVGLVIPILSGGQPDARKEAALTLGRIGGQVAVAALLDALRSDPLSGVRWRAAMMLGLCGDPDVIDDLTAACDAEDDPAVVASIEEAIQRLSGGTHGQPGAYR